MRDRDAGWSRLWARAFDVARRDGEEPAGALEPIGPHLRLP
jgi:hypothetical protein